MLHSMQHSAPHGMVDPATRVRIAPISPRRPWIWLALAITVYGGLLRYEALVANYAWAGQPAWSASLSRYAMPVAARLRPRQVTWGKTSDLFTNGDPKNYLRFAREMTHFYQAHVREPVFLASTRAWLWLCGDRDIGLGFASVAGSTAAVFATYLLGAAAFSPVVGLLAALALAIEFHAIALSIEGWRDDTFMFAVSLAGAALTSFWKNPTPLRGALAGIAMAAACLTRITALSFVLPALAFLAVAAWRSPRRKAAFHSLGVAVLVGAGLVAPYLINCALATGDPLYAINYHTQYYRAAEGGSLDHPQSALAYVSGKLAARPVGTMDTAVQGLITFPFLNKWHGFVHWYSWLPGLLLGPAAVGLVCAVFSPTGRLLLLLLITSLTPYAVTWSVGGGGEWRFTQHAYPFYLVLGAWVGVSCVRWLAIAARGGARWDRASLVPRLAQAAVALLIVVLAVVWQRGVPLLAAGEALRSGEDVTLTAGDRDAWVFSDGWSPPVLGGVPFRIARATVTAIRVPVADRSDFSLTLRMDPAETADEERQPRVTVFLDRRAIAQLRLTRDPLRMGSYRIRITGHPPRAFSRLELVASHTVPAADAGLHFRTEPPDSPVAFRLWYVRVNPES
jgi:hypothetical protein